MEHLRQLKKHYERTQGLLDPLVVPSPPESLLDQLMALFLEDKVTTDDEAAAALYGPGKDSSHKPYQKLKNKFFLYFTYKASRLPIPDKVNAKDAKFACRIFHLHGKEAKARGMFRAAETLLLKAYQFGEEIEQYSVVRDAAYELSELYAGALPNRESCGLYLHAFNKYSILEEKRSLLSLKSSELSKIFTTRDRRFTSYAPRLNKMEQEILSLVDYQLVRHHSRFFLSYHKCLVDIALLRADFNAMKERALAAVNGTSNLTYLANLTKLFFVDMLIIACCKLGQFEDCLKVIDYRFEQIDSGEKLTPYAARYYQLIALLHLKRYQEAAQISEAIKVAEVVEHFPEEQATTYYILFAYQFILFKIGKTSPVDTPQHIQEFRFSRFRNRVQIQEKNKQGYNLHIIIIELFYLVLHQRFDTFIDRMEGISKYVQRYLNNPENERNATFIRMLLSAAQFDFDASVMEQQARENLQILSALKNVAFDQDAASNEFLPFEVQWDLFLEALSQQEK